MVDYETDGREEIGNKSEIQRLLTELNESIIGFENYKGFFDKVQTSDRVIISQIENLTREYGEYKAKYLEEVKKDSFKQLVEDGFVPKAVFDYARMMNKITMESFNWKTLQEEMYSIIFKKIYAVLDDARALDIKRDALKEMREMEAQRQQMFIQVMENMGNMFRDTVGNKLQAYDEKLFNLVMMNDEEHRKDRRDIFSSMKQIVETMNIEIDRKTEMIDSIGTENQSTPPKIDRLYPKEQPIDDIPRFEDKALLEKKDEDDDFDEEEDNISDIEKSFNKRR